MSEITLRPATDDERALLVKTIVLFSDPAKWTDGALARDTRRCSVPVGSSDAVCWCAAGGIYKAEAELGFGLLSADELIARIGPLVPLVYPNLIYPATGSAIESLVGLNDHVGRESVLAVLYYALAHGVPT
jgi:hypothetical protein